MGVARSTQGAEVEPVALAAKAAKAARAVAPVAPVALVVQGVGAARWVATEAPRVDPGWM
ncbi:hypothetical protein [Chondromyces apiculatus]|nr:hypothetical protein [Chondromyces apiculatus]